jgi:hypothetical protein
MKPSGEVFAKDMNWRMEGSIRPLKIKLLALTPVLLVAGEVMFWGGIVLIGKDVYLRFKEKLKGALQTNKQDQLKEPPK